MAVQHPSLQLWCHLMQPQALSSQAVRLARRVYKLLLSAQPPIILNTSVHSHHYASSPRHMKIMTK